MQNKPNLFLVGFQKCGSSSLFDYLIQHPKIQGSKKKETFALTDESYEHFNLDNSVHNELFQWDKFFDFNLGSKYCLEGSVCNFYQKTAMNYVAKIDGAKVIFVVRDPIDRFVSSYQYYGRDGVYLKPGTSLEKYFELVQVKGNKKEAINFALEHGKYLDYIRQWQKLLGENNVLVLGMKELVNETDTLENGLSTFLNIENAFPNQMSSKNKTKVLKNKRIHLLLRKVFGGLGLRGTSVMKYYLSLNQKGAKKVVPSQELKLKLRTYYKEEYSALNEKF